MSTAVFAAIIALTGVPESEFEAIAADLGSIPPELQQTTRYISLSNVKPEDRQSATMVCSFMMNSLAAMNVASITTPKTIFKGRLVKFQLQYYASDEQQLDRIIEAWESIAASNPYTTIRAEVAIKDKEGLEEVSAVGGWIPASTAEQVVNLSGSISPVIDFGYWLAQLEGEGYYRFTGLGNRDDVVAALGIDLKEIEQLHADRAATVKRSAVAHAKPRRIRLFGGPFGSAWITYDVKQVTPDTDAVRHPLSTVGGMGTLVEYDANEYIIMGKNGLPVYLITNSEGIRQNFVDPAIARDYSESYDTFDGVIRPPFSCIRCHTEGALNEFEDYQQTLSKRGQVAKIRYARRIGELYRPDIVQTRFDFDVLLVDRATQAASKYTWKDLIEHISRLYRTYVLEDVTLDGAAATLAIDREQLITALLQTQDPYLLALAHDESINRKAWYSSLHAAYMQVYDLPTKHSYHKPVEPREQDDESLINSVDDPSLPDDVSAIIRKRLPNGSEQGSDDSEKVG